MTKAAKKQQSAPVTSEVEAARGQSMLTLFSGVEVSSKWEKALKIERVTKEPTAVLHTKGKLKGQPKVGKSGKTLMRGPVDYTTISVLPKVAGEDDNGVPRESLSRRYETTDGQQILSI